MYGLSGASGMYNVYGHVHVYVHVHRKQCEPETPQGDIAAFGA